MYSEHLYTCNGCRAAVTTAGIAVVGTAVTTGFRLAKLCNFRVEIGVVSCPLFIGYHTAEPTLPRLCFFPAGLRVELCPSCNDVTVVVAVVVIVTCVVVIENDTPVR